MFDGHWKWQRLLRQCERDTALSWHRSAPFPLFGSGWHTRPGLCNVLPAPRQRMWNMTHISPHSHVNKWRCHWPQLFHSYCCQPQVEWDHFETRNSLFMRNTWIVFILILNSVSTHTPLASHISVVLSFLACGFPNLLCTSGKSRSFVGLIRVSFV